MRGQIGTTLFLQIRLRLGFPIEQMTVKEIQANAQRRYKSKKRYLKKYPKVLPIDREARILAAVANDKDKHYNGFLSK